MAKPFGRDLLHVGDVYQLRRGGTRAPISEVPHHICRVHSVEVSEDGYIRVGVTFKVPYTGEWESEVGCWAFPSDLRAIP